MCDRIEQLIPEMMTTIPRQPIVVTLSSSVCAVLLVLLAVAAPSRAAEAAGQVGTVTFPISATAQAQSLFDRGVALLHSFQYNEAAEAFDNATRQDSRCAMCHWGKAIVLYQQIWQWPSPEDIARGRQEIQVAQRTAVKTPRERAYIEAAAAFFQGSTRVSHARRIAAYSRRLALLHRNYPADPDAAAFYALSLIALANEDVDQLANLRRAISTLQPYLRDYPDHPGVAHYLIHAADVPELAPLGLEAARKYAAIAPDSSHALHMPSHIFVRLGLWGETIALNLRAAKAGASAMAEHHGSPDYQTHALDYLAYAYLQRGQASMARQAAMLDEVIGANPNVLANMRAYLAARTALDLHQWDDATGVAIPSGTFRAISAWWARTIGAARLRDVEMARKNLASLQQAVKTNNIAMRAAGYTPSDTSVELEEAEAWTAFVEGRNDDAVAGLRRAGDREDADGGESITVPAREMLGDVLLAIGRPADAFDAYRAALRHAPNRFNSLYGAARAAQAGGDNAEARDYFNRLLSVVSEGADRPEIREAKAFVEAR